MKTATKSVASAALVAATVILVIYLMWGREWRGRAAVLSTQSGLDVNRGDFAETSRAKSLNEQDLLNSPLLADKAMGEHRKIDSFEFPFLGHVATQSAVSNVSISDKNGKVVLLPIKVHFNQKGGFLRAEYMKEGVKDYELRPEIVEVSYHIAGEKITGLPTSPPSVSLAKLLKTLHEHLGGNVEVASKFNITYVMFSQSGNPPEPSLIINVYGTGRITDLLPDRPEKYRLRFVFDLNGNLLFIDSVI